MLNKFLHLLFTKAKKFKVYKFLKIRVIFKPYFFLNEKSNLCERKFSLVTINTHNTLPVHFHTLLPMRVHDIQRCITLNFAIQTPKGMMLLKLKDRKNKINFNVSIKTFSTTHIKHKTYTNTHELFLAKMTFQIYFLKQSFKFIS